MATKKVTLPDIGEVTLVKRAGSRNLRLSVTPAGVRVSLPHWTPYSAAQAFALSHTAWIQAELTRQSHPLLIQGQKIGKLHHLRFEYALGAQTISSRVTATEVIVRMHPSEHSTDVDVQQRAGSVAVRALKREAERLLRPRLQSLADKHDLSFNGFAVKQLKRRWGSCDNHRNITLNLFLMELPWDYIDYVLLHELAHTIEMNHGERFWKQLVSMQPRARDLSRQLKKHQPVLGTWETETLTEA
jgi:predicted metal-dependent hydrolase